MKGENEEENRKCFDQNRNESLLSWWFQLKLGRIHNKKDIHETRTNLHRVRNFIAVHFEASIFFQEYDAIVLASLLFGFVLENDATIRSAATAFLQ